MAYILLLLLFLLYVYFFPFLSKTKNHTSFHIFPPLHHSISSSHSCYTIYKINKIYYILTIIDQAIVAIYSHVRIDNTISNR